MLEPQAREQTAFYDTEYAVTYEFAPSHQSQVNSLLQFRMLLRETLFRINFKIAAVAMSDVRGRARNGARHSCLLI